MPCEIWRALLDHCYEAEAAYSLILVSSDGLVGVELSEALQSAEKAREVMQVCERSLVHHERIHDCFRGGAIAKAS